ncbi:hypothetical protein [Neomesorhizobium albiziae]|uniref:hypothetical protein n=1 Tax=Neomesorhizobium albiziae TaxID=335020 RepID=UPI00122C6628|nr:hypothetical protein [Mesorhizobium albiziae]GLS34102.1 hypothetical protein GCM10007937_58150 [Mesorhizobium albiziae]
MLRLACSHGARGCVLDVLGVSKSGAEDDDVQIVEELLWLSGSRSDLLPVARIGDEAIRVVKTLKPTDSGQEPPAALLWQV